MLPGQLDDIVADFAATRSQNHTPAELAYRQTIRALYEEVERCWRQRGVVLRAMGCAYVEHDASDDAVVSALRREEHARIIAQVARASNREAIELSNALTLARNVTGIYAERLATITEALGLPVTATAEDILAAMSRATAPPAPEKDAG